MKVTTERLPKSLVALDIELDQSQVDKGLDRAARKLSQQYSIPGFRPGKAPRFIVENYLGRARIMEEASDDLINKAFKDAIKQENITPVGRANLDNVEDKPFRFRVTVPVEPEIQLPDYHRYQIEYVPEPVSEETVEKLLDAQREQHVVLRELEEMRPARDGDMVTVLMSEDADDELEDAEAGPVALEADEDSTDSSVALEADEDSVAFEDAPAGAFADEVEIEDDVELDIDEDDVELEILDENGDGVLAELDDVLDEEDDTESDEDDTGRETTLALVEGRIRPEFYEALIGAQPGDIRTVTVHHAEDDDDGIDDDNDDDE